MKIIEFFGQYEWHEYASVGAGLILTVAGLCVCFCKITQNDLIKSLAVIGAFFALLLSLACVLFKFVGIQFAHEDLTYACLLVLTGSCGFWVMIMLLLEQIIKNRRF